MEKKHGIGMNLIATLAGMIMVLVVCVLSVPSIISIGLKHLRYKVKL
jgi:hypothetical protein